MLSLLAALVATAVAAPPQFAHQGRLTDVTGIPIEGSVSLGFNLYDSANAGTQVWSDTMTVTLNNGYYSVMLGNDALDAALDNEALWIEVVANGSTLGGRQPLAAVPYAVRSQSAADGAPTNPGESCQAIKAADASAPSAAYWIDPTGNNPYRVWCEMDTLGGGWELAINLDTSDGQVQRYNEYGFWQAHSSTGDVGHPFGGDFKSGEVFSTPHKDLLIVVHRNGAPVGWRAWDLAAERSLRSYFSAEPSRNAVKVTAAALGADVANIETTEPTVRPAGGLFVNQIWGNATSYDVARLRSDTLPASDNVNWGIGISMDAQNNGGLQSQPMGNVYPGCDAASTLPWSQYLCIGTDRTCSTCGELVGGTRGLAYDYAIYVREPSIAPDPVATLSGNSAATAADTCADVLVDQPSATTGVYWLDLGGSTPFQTVCNMDIGSGGWTLMMNLDTSDGVVRHYRDDAFWAGSGGFGMPGGALTNDFKSAEVFAGSWTQMMVNAHQENLVTNGYRAWNLLGTLSFASVMSSGSSRNPVRLTNGTISSETSTLWAGEAIIRPSGDLNVNQVWGNGVSFDVARFRSTAMANVDNQQWGLGMQMDAQQNGGTESSPGLPSYPGCDAGSTIAWTSHFCMGSDVDADNGRYGATTGNGLDINYDYAIWVK